MQAKLMLGALAVVLVASGAYYLFVEPAQAPVATPPAGESQSATTSATGEPRSATTFVQSSASQSAPELTAEEAAQMENPVIQTW
jgi:hypothetical protein